MKSPWAIHNDPRLVTPMPSLAERCAYWLRGEQCSARRVDGSRFCALHDAGRRFKP